MDEIIRTGKKFAMGNPYLAGGGISYFWPGDYKDYEKIFNERREELGEYLLERARQSVEVHGLKRFGLYPYRQSGMKYETIHTGDGGEWMEFGYFISGGMVSFHNVDGYRERLMGFNLTSDALEFLDATVLAPRANVGDGNLVLVYPLANGLIEAEHFWRKEQIDKLSEFAGLGQVESVDLVNREIRLQQGRVILTDDSCRGERFTRFNAVRATKLLAKIADSFS
jgi:hypothetical protein